MPHRDRMHVPLGAAAHQHAVAIDLCHPAEEHVLVGGGAGAGKSMLLHVIGAAIAKTRDPVKMRLLGIDPKGYELAWLRELPHCMSVVERNELAGEALVGDLMRALAGRLELLDATGAASILDFNSNIDHWPRFVLFVDELLLSPYVMPALSVLLKSGGRAGIHVVVATQHAGRVPPELVAAFPTKVALHAPLAEDSIALLGTADGCLLHGARSALLASRSVAAPTPFRVSDPPYAALMSQASAS